MPSYWLAKSEPETYSIDDLKKNKTTMWDSVRNYQARNNLQAMNKGDLVLFYHSNAKPSGVAGVCKVVKEAYPDPVQFDKRSDYYDEKATKEKPRWFCPDVQFVEKFASFVPLDLLRQQQSLSKMELLRRGSRLSVVPVTKKEFDTIVKLGKAK